MILREIDALEKRARDKLSPAELKHVDAAINRQLKGLRTWAQNVQWRPESKESMGPTFSEFLRHRETGTDIRRAPRMHEGAGIAGLEMGVKTKAKSERHESSFSWTAVEGSFVKEWSAEDPVDEEYRARVTGYLRLYLLVEVTVAGQVIRVEAETKKNIFDRYPITLRGSEAEIVDPR
jgi:hypothetical protein